MPDKAHSTADMISGMTPALQPGAFVFITATDPAQIAAFTPHAMATFQEAEGLSLIVPVDVAAQAACDTDSPMRCITLNVYSSLEGIGLTAAVSTALGDAAIPCNIVAAYHHDHVFVPADKCDHAVEILKALQNGAREKA